MIAALNEKTNAFLGIQGPVKILIDKDSKTFEIEVGTPPTSALIKGELGIKENVKEEAGVKGKKTVGNLTVDQLKKIAGMKSNLNLSKSEDALMNEIAGTCLSMGVTIEGKSPKDWIKEHGKSKK
ncbi:50S ribosomal protein L11 [uncultured archaeon]|nr:50S ribosomal protein L11 [uncultured archaeon]